MLDPERFGKLYGGCELWLAYDSLFDVRDGSQRHTACACQLLLVMIQRYAWLVLI